MNPIKLWVSYEKNLKKIGKAFKENMVQDKKTGVWKNKKMAIKELERKNRLLGKRCIQLLKDKGELIDKIADIKANCDLAIEGRDVKIMELEQELTVEKDLLQEETNLHLHAEDYIKSLEQKLEQTEKDLADYQFNYPTIKELEEEIRKKADTNHSLVEQMAEQNEQLEQSKEIIKKFIQWNYGCCDIPDYKKIVKQAEQFLKEIEKGVAE